MFGGVIIGTDLVSQEGDFNNKILREVLLVIRVSVIRLLIRDHTSYP